MSEAAIPEEPPVIQSHSSSNQFHRYVHVTAFVAFWMAIGWVYHLDGWSYLLIGIPLVAMFQIFIRKKSLVTLWVRDATQFRLTLWGIILAIALVVRPMIKLNDSLKSSSWLSHIPENLWTISCIAGALCAGFSLCHFTRETWKSLLYCMVTAGLIACAIMIGMFLAQNHPTPTLLKVRAGISKSLLYFPVCFILEEVAFRGAIDSHVHQPGDKHSWRSALYVSALWGLWHLPITGAKGILQVIALAMMVTPLHMATGLFLSIYWRRSGNLAVPAAVHAFIDGVRDTLLR